MSSDSSDFSDILSDSNEQSSSSDEDKHINSAHAKRCKPTTPSVTKGKGARKKLLPETASSTSLKDKVKRKKRELGNLK